MALEAQGQLIPEYEESPIHYSETVVSNRADAVGLDMKAGKVEGIEAGGKELLSGLLKAFEVPVDSQVLVFSKTSLQGKQIGPRSPRAIYFSDDAYLGWVPGGLYELTLNDPQLGLVFYAIDGEARTVQRSRDCLSCHGGSRTRYWPGVLVRSVYPDYDGHPITSAGGFLTGHESPLEERWGGWYVTGEHGDSRHMGNVTAVRDGRDAEIDRNRGANVTDLSRFYDPDLHLRNDSDIVALMVLEHQCEMHNRISRAMLRVRKWTDYQKRIYESLGEPLPPEPSGTAKTVIDGETENLIEHLLFRGEIRLPRGGVQGAGDFEKAFRRNRREDAAGRSLKDFDLETRLFAYRCSYMIYSEAWGRLPDVLKASVYGRLMEILDAEIPPDKYDHLPRSERRAIKEILLATKPEILKFVPERDGE